MWPMGRKLFSVLHLVVYTLLILPGLQEQPFAFNFLWHGSNTSHLALSILGGTVFQLIFESIFSGDLRWERAEPGVGVGGVKGFNYFFPKVSFQIPETSDLEGLRSGC